MFERLKRVFALFSDNDDAPDESGNGEDDRDAGIPVQVRRGPPDRGSSVAVAEPDDDE